MTRLTGALVALLSFLPPASASLAPPKDRPPLQGKELSRLPPDSPREGSAPGQEEFAITNETQILLNGRPCRYRDVPGNAAILRMEVTPDKKILKVHFGTQR